MKHVIIYTDGACRGNPGIGGWGVVMYYVKHKKILSGAEAHTTNNRMELTAALQALIALKEACQIDLHTDSQYVQKGMTIWLEKWKRQGWRSASKKPIKNADLWQLLDIEVARHRVTWHWVKAHCGHPENELADTIANDAIDEWQRRMS